MTVTLGPLRKMTQGATQAQAMTELQQLLTDLGATIYDTYSSGGVLYVTAQVIMPGGYTTPVYLNCYVTAALIPGFLGIFQAWNTSTHLGTLGLVVGSVNMPSNAWGAAATYNYWAQAIRGADWVSLVFHSGTVGNNTLQATDTLTDGGLRVYASATVPSGWPAGLPLTVVSAVSSGAAAAWAGFTQTLFSYPLSATASSVVTAPLVALSNTAAAFINLPNGLRSMIYGHQLIAADGTVLRLGASDIVRMVTATGVNILACRDYPAGDRLVASAGSEEYAISYGSAGTGNSQSTSFELLRTA